MLPYTRAHLPFCHSLKIVRFALLCFVSVHCLLFGFDSVRLRIYNYLVVTAVVLLLLLLLLRILCDRATKNGSNNNPPGSVFR